MLPPPPADGGSFLDLHSFGFNVDATLLTMMAARSLLAGLLASIIAFRPWRRFMNTYFEQTESGAQVLISVAGGLMTAIIGSVPGNAATALAFALVGLGGFIRFRSGIKDPREAGVMFLMIAIGMACGIGNLPVAIVATGLGVVLLSALDLVEGKRKAVAFRRIRFSDVENPREVEPQIRNALGTAGVVRGSKVGLKRDEISVDVFGEKLTSAGVVIQLLEAAGITITGDVACEEI